MGESPDRHQQRLFPFGRSLGPWACLRTPSRRVMNGGLSLRGGRDDEIQGSLNSRCGKSPSFVSSLSPASLLVDTLLYLDVAFAQTLAAL